MGKKSKAATLGKKGGGKKLNKKLKGLGFSLGDFQAALQQLRADGLPERLEAKLDATQWTDENRAHWKNADSLSARSAYNVGERAIARDRSRYEDANNSFYHGMINTAVQHTVGTGPRLQILSGDEEARTRVETEWLKWCVQTGFVAELACGYGADWRDGEAFFMRRVNRRAQSDQVALKVRCYEGDQVTTPYASPADPSLEDGIRLDADNEPIAYHFLDHHPGDLNVPHSAFLEGQWYPEADVAHLFLKRRPNQFRGLPRILASLELFPKLRRHTLAVLAAAEAVANWTLFMRTNSSATILPKKLRDDFGSIEFSRAMLNFLPDGWEPFQLKAEQPTTTHEMFQRQTLMEIARAACFPYLLMAGTSKDSNYSSAQMDLRNIWKPAVVGDQGRIVSQLLEKVFIWWMEEAVFVPGLLHGLPPISQIKHAWHFDPLPTQSDQEEAETGRTLLETGQVTPSELFAKRNKDFDASVKRMAQDYGVPEAEIRRALFVTHFPKYAASELKAAEQTVGSGEREAVTRAADALSLELDTPDDLDGLGERQELEPVREPEGVLL